MRTIVKDNPEYADLLRLKCNIINDAFNKFPDRLLREEVQFAVPTVMTFTSRDVNELNDILKFIRHISLYYRQNKVYVIPVFSDMSIAGEYKSYISRDIIAEPVIEVESVIGEIDINDSPQKLMELFELPQFEDVVSQGYLAFDPSSKWLIFDSEHLDSMVFFSMGSLRQDFAVSLIDERYVMQRDDFLENLNYSYDLSVVQNFEQQYLDKFYFK